MGGIRDFVEFPPTNMLGYSLDFTTASPTDVKSILASIKRGRRLLQYYPDEDTRKQEVDGVMYDIPKCIGVQNPNMSDGNYITYRTGTEAASALQIDASVSARYLAVSASVSTSYSLTKTYRREDQWAMYSFNSDAYNASMRDYADLLAQSALANRLEEMSPINGNNKTSVQEWKDFFASWGSHAIIQTGFGARYQLNVHASNSDSSVNQKFSTNVTAAFNGIGAGGQFDSSVKTEEQYKTFSEFMQKTVSVMGGNSTLNKDLTADPARNDMFVQWAGSAGQDSALTSLNVIELWVLMRDASRKEIRDAAPMVLEAYNFICDHPQPYKTLVTLDIQSDWAEFNLLSPSGVIIPNPDYPFPDKTVMSNTRVQWGKEYSHEYQRQTLRFAVVNDGSPIDFSISHGSDGGKPKEGRAEVLMEGISYLNDSLTDNVWNTEWYYQKRVSSTPQSTKMDVMRQTHSWDHVLRGYLEEIDAIKYI